MRVPSFLSYGLFCGVLCFAATSVSAADWEAQPCPLTTPWAEDVSPENALPEYPRPQLVRDAWTNLNGLWDYAISGIDADEPGEWDGEILVPFAVESSLSGVAKSVGPQKLLWYRRTFARPALDGGRLLLHFGAVDWEAQVWVNGMPVGEHRGGYDPFTLDITAALTNAVEQEIVVRVWDPVDTGTQPRGKQVLHPGGIFYTSVTGIWQTVWLEPVPEAYIRRLKITPNVDESAVEIEVEASGAEGDVRVTVSDGDRVVARGSGASGSTIRVGLPKAKLWSPEDPHLYDLTVTLGKDEVQSYFGMRKIEMRKDDAGVNRLFLNNRAAFQFGPLDQGWWPDGLYTAPTDEALRYDVEITRKLGFNMARKHTKVEPARWYYWADKLGLLVWQDMPSMMARGQAHQVRPGQENDAKLTAQTRMEFHTELRRMLDQLHNHPSIVVWVPFNEGWGQHDTNEVLQWTKTYDSSRLVDGPSGWEDRGWGDMKDMHNYPGPGMFPTMEDRASVLGEFGGLGLPIEGHLWQPDQNWGYRTYKTREELASHYQELIRNLHVLIGRGLAAAVYTQTTDVEVEVNGLLTYDRRIVKIDAEQLRKWHEKLFGPPPVEKVVLATSENKPANWSYTTTSPSEGWMKIDFDASGWKSGPAGFGTGETPNTTVRTVWKTEDIWIRREFTLPDDADLSGDWMLSIHHDEDAEVYLNGVAAATLTGYTSNYRLAPVSKEGAKALRPGRNVIAIHCRQTRGGQYIDAGLVQLVMGD